MKDNIHPRVRIGIARKFLKEIENSGEDIDITIDKYVNVYYTDINKEVLRKFLWELADLVTDPI